MNRIGRKHAVIFLAILLGSAMLSAALVSIDELSTSDDSANNSNRLSPDVIEALVQKLHEYRALAVNNLFFVNGAAIVGLLTFLGHHFATDDSDRIKRGKLLMDRSIPAFMSWIAGLVCSLLLGFGLYQALEAYILGELRGFAGLSLRAINGTLTLSGVAYFIAGTVFTCAAFIEFSLDADNHTQTEKEEKAEE